MAITERYDLTRVWMNAQSAALLLRCFHLRASMVESPADKLRAKARGHHAGPRTRGKNEDGSLMIKDIVRDVEFLSQPCEPATADDAPVAQDVLDTLMATENAACLAANQIGVTKCIVAYLNDADKPVVMYNPKLTQGLHPFGAIEGCLSRDDEDVSAVTRYKWIKVAYEDLVDGKLVPRKKKLEGWTAQIVQHMIDHCKGNPV